MAQGCDRIRRLPLAFLAQLPSAETALVVRPLSRQADQTKVLGWYHREPLKGALFFAAQAASIAVCAWSAGKRDGRFDPNHGWYKGNEAAYNRYTNYARIGFGIGIGSYVIGVMDYFLNTPNKP